MTERERYKNFCIQIVEHYRRFAPQTLIDLANWHCVITAAVQKNRPPIPIDFALGFISGYVTAQSDHFPAEQGSMENIIGVEV